MLRNITLLASALATGLMAGLFYSFFFAVMPGLKRADDRTFVRAMQEINVAITNGWFMLIFFGAFVFTAAAAVLHLSGDRRPVMWWILAGLVFYVLALLVTFAFNIPLNDQLAKAGDPSKIQNLADVRAKFESSWVAWNAVRAFTNTVAFGFLSWALFIAGRATA